MDDTSGAGAPGGKADSGGGWKRHVWSLGRDFLLIVTGVLTALALENWNAANSDRRLEADYLRALAADTRTHVAKYEGMVERLTRQREQTATIWSWANGARPDVPYREVILWISLGGQFNLDTRFQVGAYQDLVNAGRLSLIRNRAIRDALIDYHNYQTRWNSILDTWGERSSSEYGEAVEGVIDPEIAWTLTTQDSSAIDLTPTLFAFRARPAVRHALVAMAQSHQFRIGVARNAAERAAALVEMLEAELDSS